MDVSLPGGLTPTTLFLLCSLPADAGGLDPVVTSLCGKLHLGGIMATAVTGAWHRAGTSRAVTQHAWGQTAVQQYGAALHEAAGPARPGRVWGDRGFRTVEGALSPSPAFTHRMNCLKVCSQLQRNPEF